MIAALQNAAGVHDVKLPDTDDEARCAAQRDWFLFSTHTMARADWRAKRPKPSGDAHRFTNICRQRRASAAPERVAAPLARLPGRIS